MISKLPNAPLTEVIFEMRWKLIDSPALPFDVDPSYFAIFDTFTNHCVKKGFSKMSDLHPPYTGTSGISRRCHKGEDQFPLLQIGPGIFAANDSVEYEWKSFKKMAFEGAEKILRHYPKIKDHKLQITHLELRYLDTFEGALVGSSDFIEFMQRGTQVDVTLPDLWETSDSNRLRRGRFLIDIDLKKPSDSKFTMDIASAKKEDSHVIRMVSRVAASDSKILAARNIDAQLRKLDSWMEDAHAVTSESFKKIISKRVFEQFK